MYAVRPAVRSASIARPKARFIHGRRFPLSIRIQPFHTTRRCDQTPNPPPPSENTSVSENDADQNRRESEAASSEAPAAVTHEDPEVLAQKLQRSKEMTRRYSSALRRSQRRNRAQDLPPIYIPEWFLDRRVRLRKENSRKRAGLALSLKHDASGHSGTCEIPMLAYSTAVQGVLEIFRVMWGTGWDKDVAMDFAQKLAEQVRLGYDPNHLNAVEGDENLDWNAIAERHAASNDQTSSGAEGENGLEGTDKQAITGGESKDDIQRPVIPITQDESHLGRSSEAAVRGRVSPLLYAEIRATIAAALSTTQPSVSDTFPSSKTNLILHSPSNRTEPYLVSMVHILAAEVEADLVTLTAQDLARIAGDYLGEGPEPSPHSIRSLGYDTYRPGSEFVIEVEELGKEDVAEEEEQGSSTEQSDFLRNLPVLITPGSLGTSKSLKDWAARRLSGHQASGGDQGDGVFASAAVQTGRSQTQSDAQLEDLKLATLLEALIDANEVKRARNPTPQAKTERSKSSSRASTRTSSTFAQPKFFDFSTLQGDAKREFAQDMADVLPAKIKQLKTVTIDVQPSLRQYRPQQKPKIIYIKDIKELNATQHGGRILQKLEDIIRKQRSSGQRVMLLGTTCSEVLTPEMSASGVQGLQSEAEAGFYRTIVVPIPSKQHELMWAQSSPFDSIAAAKARVIEGSSSKSEKSKFRHINLLHIQDMLQCLNPVASRSLADPALALQQAQTFGHIYPESYFWKVLTYDEVHRIALTALGLHDLDSPGALLSWAHVALSMGLLKASDEQKFAWMQINAPHTSQSARTQVQKQMDKVREALGLDPIRKVREAKDQSHRTAEAIKRQKDISRIAATATKHEKKLMHGIVNSDQIKTTFDQVHVPKDTVDAIRTLTSLSLLRPDAFDYGVLATEKISGALLYGPPGTGKTLLAKAVAKESGSTVLEVSGSQIMDKYVGEGEKNVAAIFSLARKLSPCIVFLDEADAVFGSRDSSRDRASHRDILNQFLKEWDGLNDLSVFVMVATNRPFDMDDAVIRRLPRRLLVDLPTEADRKKILEIHLRGEQLDGSVNLDEIAKQTPLYSGSDLKNVAVFAALACVKEENEEAAIAVAKAATDLAAETVQSNSYEHDVSSTSPKSDTVDAPMLSQSQKSKYQFPERRTLYRKHFEKALQEVSASISEDMSSLNAIKKFDEQFGDRKGQRKRKAYGFGLPAEKDDNAARVRT